MSNSISAGRVRTIYEFIRANQKEYSVQMMCRVLGVAPSGYCECLHQPVSNRAQYVSNRDQEDDLRDLRFGNRLI